MQLPHQARVVSFKGYNPDAYSGDQISGPDDPDFGKRLLCEGDSWFSLGAIPSSNMLFPLHFRQSTLLMNLAAPGDTLLNMANPKGNAPLKEAIASTRWDAIFISGGGNDLIDNLLNIICTPSVGAGQHFLDYIDRIELAKLRVSIHLHHLEFGRLRDNSRNQGVPIVTHVYDYPTPRDAPANIAGAISLKGPWLYPALMTRKVPDVFWIPITDYIFESLGSALVELSGLIENFHVITKTKGVLQRAACVPGNNGDWLNEIHPNRNGYRKLSEVVSPELDAILFSG
ncbi:hypothetical protein M5C97_11165 [Acidovorax sp. NCPPB 3859]|nr:MULTISPECIES: hypothetical protein [unclassified Acidovorax]MDA8450740.1 hypothetical protein [Acidovorax sp. GBBC 3297]MDA8460175.1 hypothetical protein [Acidovorax sp. GBBC 3333]MDA8465221.1 hypothetical protein [Acidovorax sp. GBBC 3332]MDA8470245.1 hypothetical protein [Acidovorax sp. GBBC 3299]WCM80789.1 hypothetical protein M5C94_11120 [Acidovorax sp. GBBC 712]